MPYTTVIQTPQRPVVQQCMTQTGIMPVAALTFDFCWCLFFIFNIAHEFENSDCLKVVIPKCNEIYDSTATCPFLTT